MNFKENKKKEIHLDITPIVDTVFNLLIFFALSLNFTSQSSIDINLPKLDTLPAGPAPREIIISISAQKKIFLNQQKTASADLAAALKKLGPQAAHNSIIIQADERVDHGTVVAVMGRCKQAGFKKIAIAASTTSD